MKEDESGLIKLNNISVPKDCYKKLKHMQIEKEISLHEVIREILIKFTSKKTFDVISEVN